MKRLLVSGMVLYGWITLAAIATPRVWLDDQGREVTAAFDGIEDDGKSVRLKMNGGRVIPFPLSRLSPVCQAYVDEEKTRSGALPDHNFDGEWPDYVGFRDDPEIEVVREDKEKQDYVYESKNFRYACDVKLNRSVVRGFAMLFEATHKLCKEMPIGMGEGVRTEGKYLIQLFEDRENYVKAGAPAQSAGVFMGHLNQIMVPLESAGVVKRGSAYSVDRSSSNRVLAHEIVHQLTPPAYFAESQFNSWFIEGIAEYVASAPYKHGYYNLRLHRKAAIDYATGFSKVDQHGRNIGSEIRLSALEKFMNLSYREFVEGDANFNYAVALLLTYYFIHFDGEGDAANLKAYKRALLEGKSRDEAHQVLLNGRTFTALERDVVQAWRKFGVRFQFGS